MYSDTNLRRFFIETYNNEEMYYEYLKGQIYLNRDLYAKWFNEADKRNSMFASYMLEFNRIKAKDIIIESKTSDELSVSKYLHNRSSSNVSSFEKFKIEKKPLGESSFCYICNGYFEDTLQQIYNVLDKGSFTVGICGEKKTEIFRDVVEHYNKLKYFLLKQGYTTGAIQTNVSSKTRVYFLMYDYFKQKRLVKK